MSIKKYYLIQRCLTMCLYSILYSCNTDNEQKLLKEINLIQSKPINCNQYKWSHDNTTIEKLKYIVYSDSVNCISCSIHQMDLWNALLEYSKSYNGQLHFYFIFRPAKKDIKSVESILNKNVKFNYPILLDTLGEFEKLNPHLPKNHLLHTFLLDENNRVVLVGNPLRNKKIEEMFYKIVEEKLGKH